MSILGCRMIGFVKTVVVKILRMVANGSDFSNFQIFHLNVTDKSATHIGQACACEEITLETLTRQTNTATKQNITNKK